MRHGTRGLGRISPPRRPLQHRGPRVARLAEPALAAALRRHLPDLLALPNVRAVGIGRKYTRHQPTGDISVVVHVEGKVVPGDLPSGAMVPVTLNDPFGTLITDVVPSGVPRLFGLRGGHELEAFDGQTGLCGLTLAAEGVRYALTCAHVVVNVVRERQGPVRWRARGATLNAGEVVLWAGFEGTDIHADGAVVRLPSGLAAEPWHLDGLDAPINAIGRFQPADRDEYFYIAPEGPIVCISPSWIPTGLPRIDGRVWQAHDFWALRVSRGVARPGHSGALVVKAGIGGYVAMGFLFAGSENDVGEPTVWVFPFTTIWNSLRLGRIPL